MALRQYINGEWKEVGSVSKQVGDEIKPLSAIYQCVNGRLVPVWEAGNLRTKDGLILQTIDGKIINVII